MKLSNLLLLNEQLVEKAQKMTFRPTIVIKPVKVSPIKAIKSWVNDNGYLTKDFSFPNVEVRNRFAFRVLSYEEEKGHHGVLTISEKEIKISVTTRDLEKVTELDKEYARDVDLIYRELNVEQ